MTQEDTPPLVVVAASGPDLAVAHAGDSGPLAPVVVVGTSGTVAAKVTSLGALAARGWKTVDGGTDVPPAAASRAWRLLKEHKASRTGRPALLFGQTGSGAGGPAEE